MIASSDHHMTAIRINDVIALSNHYTTALAIHERIGSRVLSIPAVGGQRTMTTEDSSLISGRNAIALDGFISNHDLLDDNDVWSHGFRPVGLLVRWLLLGRLPL